MTAGSDFTQNFAIDSDSFRQLLPVVFQRCGYDPPDINDSARTAIGRAATQHKDHFSTQSRRQAELRWSPIPGGRAATKVAWNVYETSSGGRNPYPQKAEELGASISVTVALWLSEEAIRRSEAPNHDPVLGPGEPLDREFTGTLLDYSGCAREGELLDLTGGDLPLGRYAFGFESPPKQTGSPLYLARFANGERMEYNGVLLCAPQNSGKTRWIIRWAQAASNAVRPRALFIIDVKGNLRQKLRGEIVGDVFSFSTDPRDSESDRINFLDGPMGFDEVESDRLRQIATALLPSRGFVERGGINEYHYRNRVIWLTAFIHILKLAQFYRPHWFVDDENAPRSVDLADLYELLSSESVLYSYMEEILGAEAERRDGGLTTPGRGVAFWISELAVMLDGDRVTTGERLKRETFRSYTITLLSALEPFAPFGTLHKRVRSFGAGRLFDLETTLGSANRPVTVILSARMQDLEKAATVLSLTIKRLTWFLFDRMTQPDADDRPVMLLLDETRRIADFDAAEYITFAREAKATCVLAYQALDQIGPPAKVNELLENVGAQIYLGSLVGASARHFINILPKRWRSRVSRQVVKTSSGESTTTTTTQEQIDYFTSAELYRFPAGRWPALIYINDQPRRKPFFTDVDEDAAVEGARPKLLQRRVRSGSPPVRPEGVTEIVFG